MGISDNPAVGSELHTMDNKKDYIRNEKVPSDTAVFAPECKKDKGGEHNEEQAWN